MTSDTGGNRSGTALLDEFRRMHFAAAFINRIRRKNEIPDCGEEARRNYP